MPFRRSTSDVPDAATPSRIPGPPRLSNDDPLGHPERPIGPGEVPRQSTNGRGSGADGVELSREPFSLWDVIRASPLLIVGCVVIAVAAAAALVAQRNPEYTAQTRLGLVRVDASAPGALAGFATAAQALAETYSRATTSSAVINATVKRTGLTRAEVRKRIRTAPIPNTPIFRITATGPTRASAIGLANVASEELQQYIVDLNRQNPDARRTYLELGKWEMILERRRAVRDARKSDFAGSKSPELRSRLADAEASLSTAAARSQALRDAYVAAVGANATSQNVQIINRATDAISDRSSKLQLAVFAAVVVGLVVGAALSLLRLVWRRRTGRASRSGRHVRTRSRRHRRRRVFSR